MQLDKDMIVGRYMQLSEKEKEAVRAFLRSPYSVPVAKLLGVAPSEFSELLQMARQPKKGLASRPI